MFPDASMRSAVNSMTGSSVSTSATSFLMMLFFDLYYHELPESDPLAAAPTSWDQHIASLDEVRAHRADARACPIPAVVTSLPG